MATKKPTQAATKGKAAPVAVEAQLQSKVNELEKILVQKNQEVGYNVRKKLFCP